MRASDHLPDRFNSAAWFVGPARRRGARRRRGDRHGRGDDALRRARPRGPPLRRGPAPVRIASRRPRRAPPAGRPALLDRVLGGDRRGRRRGPAQHAVDSGNPRTRPRRLRPAVFRVRLLVRRASPAAGRTRRPGPRTRPRTGCGRRNRSRATPTPIATPRPSCSTRAGRRGSPRASSTSSTTPGSAAARTARTSSASVRATAASRSPGCSSRTDSATRSTFRTTSERRACFSPDGRHPRRSSTRSAGIARRSSSAFRRRTPGCSPRWRRAPPPTSRACAPARAPGRPCPASVWERWRERTGLEILDGIGSSETGHCFLSNHPARGAAGLERPARPRLRRAARRRERRGRRPRGDRRSPGARGFHDGLLLEQARGHQAHPARRVDPHRRQVPPGRRRLLLALGPQRRHAQGRRHLGLAGRSRGGARGARGRPGVRGRRAPGRRRARQGARVRGAARRSRRRRDSPTRCGPSPGSASSPTSARAGSRSCPSCRRPRPARSSGSGCARAAPAD